ncbi:MAG: aldehyde dehydrogenase [Planctomycetota bacterium]|nr:MAG: aldehyde dehydrogenase [Planctomycetota bacterium]
MLHIPILRNGKPYESVDKVEIVHHATGEPVALVSQANSGMVTRDVARMNFHALDGLTVPQLMNISRKAAELFMTASLPLGDTMQSFDDYIHQLSATTGMPQALCRNNAQKIHRVMHEIETVISGLTRGFDLSIIDQGFGLDGGRMLSWFRRARVFGAVLPSNSPGVHSLWIPAIVLKTPVALKPGREEPWSPNRVLQAFMAAGAPAEAFGFYPTDHAGAAALLRATDRSMLFGDASIARTWQGDSRVEVHGPGYSKVILGEDTADHWEKYVEVMASSIFANGGRSCLNASAIWTPRHGRQIAEAVAAKLAGVKALPADHPDAKLAAFANPKVAESISATVDAGLREPGAEDVTMRLRGSPRLVKEGRIAWLLPTIIRCDSHEHPLANREFLFPFASVVECPVKEMPERIGPSLIVSTITGDKRFISAMMGSSNVDRLNIGPIPTWRISWDQPHEGNLFEHLYRQRAFQIESAA